MTARRPLVVGSGGTMAQIPDGDSLLGAVLLGFSGGLTSVLVGTVDAYLAMGPPGLLQLSPTAIRYPLPFDRTVQRLLVYVRQNSLATSTTVWVAKNGTDTGITLTIGAGATGSFSDLSNTSAFTDGDQIDVHVQSVNGGTANTLELAATVLI